MSPMGCDNVLLMDKTSLTVCCPPGLFEEADFEEMQKRFKYKYDQKMKSLAKLTARGGSSI